MFASILFFTFLSTCIAIVALGHVMLAAAIWPGLFAGGTEPRHGEELDSPAGAGRHVLPYQ